MKWILGIFVLFLSSALCAQTVRSYSPPAKPKQVHQPRQPYSATAGSTTPLNCEQQRNHPHPAIHPMCERWERDLVQGDAKRQGQPVPSTSVLTLPALGTSESARAGAACVGGRAMKKLPNGWEQMTDSAGNWQRCRGG